MLSVSVDKAVENLSYKVILNHLTNSHRQVYGAH